ncbi:MFS transporter [Candidatus Bipolaricaulota bacterium]|nr:MFS transporter [Candidatus Bipolaricaulota bacterium]
MSGNVDDRWRARFFTIWTGQQLSLIGTTVGSFALIWWLTTTTGSATVLATASMVAVVPAILLSPFIGALVDRWNRKRIILISDMFIALISLWLAYLFWSGAMLVWHVYVVLIARGLGSSFHSPAMTASTTLMVPKRHLTRISGLNMTVGGAQGIIGPPLGALLLVLLPLHGVMLVDVGTALFAVLPLLFLAIPQPDRAPAGATTLRSVVADTVETVRLIVRWRGLMALLGVLLVMKLFITPAFSLSPLLVFKHFGRGATDLSLLQALAGAGIVTGGLIMGAWGGFRRKVVTMLIGLAGVGLGVSVMGFAPITFFPVALAGRLLIGLMLPVASAPHTAIMQATIPPHMQGRFFATLASLFSLTMPIGLAIAGPFSDAFGVASWYRLGGLIAMGAAVAGFFLPSLMRIEEEAGALRFSREQQDESPQAGTAD